MIRILMWLWRRNEQGRNTSGSWNLQDVGGAGWEALDDQLVTAQG